MKSEELVTSYLSSNKQEMYFEGVLNHTKEISHKRNMNSYYTQLLAIYHNFSDLKKSDKKNHKLVNKILIDLGVETDECDLIKTALKQLNNELIVNDTTEVVKDAIALTRNDMGLKNSRRDKARCQYALSNGLDVNWGHGNAKSQIYQLRKDLLGYLEDMSDDAIHELRISIRKLLSILWLIDHGSFGISKIESEKIRQNLRVILKLFAKAREYAVLIEQMEHIGFDEIGNYAKKKLKSTKKKNAKKLDEQMLNHIVMACDDLFKICEKIDFSHMSVKSVLKQYLDLVSNLETKDVTTLHQFRIEGKTFKYLHEGHIIKFEEETYKLMKELHKQIGLWHDVQVNRELTIGWIKSDKIDLSKKKTKQLMEHFEAIENKTYKKIEFGVFKMKKHLDIVR
jgi:CHAD domain-containing protein